MIGKLPAVRILSFAVSLWLVLGAGFGAVAHAERIKDLATVAGVRSNQLIGYGLVVGLAGTGDQTSQAPFTVQSLTNMLAQFGVKVPSNVNPQLKNVAAVMVSATLGPFMKNGQTIDVTVSSIGNAKSLRGGTLLMTPLRGADGRVYAIAQGSVTVGGVSAKGASGSSVQVNVPSAGRIPNGATVERTVPTPFDHGNSITLDLNSPDFTTAERVAKAINKTMGAGTAVPRDADSVKVRAPSSAGQRVAFVSILQNLKVTPASAPARVVVNARTGTVVIGSHVRVSPAAVSQGNLTVTISENPRVSQPAPFSRGRTARVPNSKVSVKQNAKHMFLFNPGVSLDKIVQAVNQVGATPSDLVSILEALHKAGALHAQLIVI